MKAKFSVGDILVTSHSCKAEGKRLFGKDFLYENFKDEVIKVFENTKDERDGMGDLIPNVYEFDNGETLAEAHLELYRNADGQRPIIKCGNCERLFFTEEELDSITDVFDGEPILGCETCGTDGYLIDLGEEAWEEYYRRNSVKKAGK